MWVLCDVGYVCPRHEVEEVEDEGGGLAQQVVRLATVRLETDVVGTDTPPQDTHVRHTCVI